jgi:AraC-like DNA-binding protein
LGFAQAARARLILLLVASARLAAVEPACLPRPLLARVFRFIDVRYKQPISLVDVARAVKKSPAYLTSVVKKETGRSVQAWIIERRMAEARRRLVETDEPVAEIAEDLGYADATYFARQFRKAHGATPLAWRRGSR